MLASLFLASFKILSHSCSAASYLARKLIFCINCNPIISLYWILSIWILFNYLNSSLIGYRSLMQTAATNSLKSAFSYWLYEVISWSVCSCSDCIADYYYYDWRSIKNSPWQVAVSKIKIQLHAVTETVGLAEIGDVQSK